MPFHGHDGFSKGAAPFTKGSQSGGGSAGTQGGASTAQSSNPSLAGQREEERRARSWFRFEPDVPPMPLDQFFTEVEAQSCPSDASCTRIPSTDKWPEEARLLFIWNPHALIANAKTSFVRREAFLKRDIDEASKRTVLEGIGEQVRKDLFDPEGVD